MFQKIIVVLIVLLSGVVVFFGVKYFSEEKLVKKEEEEVVIDYSTIQGTFYDSKILKSSESSKIMFGLNKTFIFTANVCTGMIEFNGTYEVKNYTNVLLTFDSTNKFYADYFGNEERKNEYFVLNADGTIMYNGSGWGCSPKNSETVFEMHNSDE